MQIIYFSHLKQKSIYWNEMKRNISNTVTELYFVKENGNFIYLPNESIFMNCKHIKKKTKQIYLKMNRNIISSTNEVESMIFRAIQRKQIRVKLIILIMDKRMSLKTKHIKNISCKKFIYWTMYRLNVDEKSMWHLLWSSQFLINDQLHFFLENIQFRGNYTRSSIVENIIGFP